MSRFVLITPKYASPKAPNEMGFIHSRVKAYIKNGHSVDVFVPSNKSESYDFEGVKVKWIDAAKIQEILNSSTDKYDGILIHFLNKTIMDIVGDRVCYIWVHGFEALSWKRRLFNVSYKLPIQIIENMIRLYQYKNYAKHHPKSKFIFVSSWMHDITCSDIKFNIENYEIVPNYINSDIFTYEPKNKGDRKKILLLRSFANRKYANDISVKIIKELSKKSYFNELEISVYGKGKLFEKLTKPLCAYSNVQIHNQFFTQEEVAKLHKKFGVFLCPTRQDAQGVSMCEAMSSGLIPLTSNSTAIPNFVENNIEGFLCDNKDIETFINAYESIYYDEEKFLKMSKEAAMRVRRQCSYDYTIKRELEIIGC